VNARQAQDAEHEQILREMLEQFQPVFDHSPMGVYLYLDDVHKLCNERMAKMFGVTVKEWNAMPSFLADFVDDRDQEMVASNYQHHVAQLTHPVTFFLSRQAEGRQQVPCRDRHDPDLLARQSGCVPLCARGQGITRKHKPLPKARGVFVFLR
jgi:PAS domain-containing protein